MDETFVFFDGIENGVVVVVGDGVDAHESVGVGGVE